MKKIRTIARLDVKGNCLIKSISLEGLRKVGIPSIAAKNYYEQLQVPEIITPTFVDFNKDAVQAYKNSLERVKDNPELQGAIRKVFYNIFPSHK